MYDRLYRLAFKKTRNHERAYELAAEALTRSMETALSKDVALEWHYASVVLMNLLRTSIRDASRREISLPNKPDDEIVELRRMSVEPTQIEYAMICDTMRGMECLPEPSRNVLILTALEYSVDEICEQLDMPKKEVYWRTRVARKTLKEKGYWEPPQKGQYQWIGIRRDCRKWQAEIKVEGKSIYLGHFTSAADAAKAYDEAARTFRGPTAKLNFPEVADG